MFSKTWLINMLLATFTLVFGMKAYGVWSEEERDFQEKAVVESEAVPFTSAIAKKAIPPESEYEPMVAKDLFRQDRKEFIPEEPDQEQAPDVGRAPLSSNRIALSGVVLADDYQSALIRAPAEVPGQRPERWVQVGDTVEGYRIAEIKDDRIVLKGAGEEAQILLYDRERPKQRMNVAKSGAPTVLSVASERTPERAVRTVEEKPRAESEKTTVSRPAERPPEPPVTRRTDPRQDPRQESQESRPVERSQAEGGGSLFQPPQPGPGESQPGEAKGIQDLRQIFERLTRKNQ